MENITVRDNLPVEIPDKSIEDEQKEKVKDLKKQKGIFYVFFSVFGAVIMLSLITIISYSVYINYFAPRIQVIPIQPPEEPQTPQTLNPSVEKTVQYKSDNLKLSLEYAKEAKLVDTWGATNQTKKLEIFFSKDAGVLQSSESISDSKISEGYIFRISTFTTNIRNLDDIAKVKKESVVTGCPESAEFSETFPVKINDVDSRFFEVKNCRGDFTITYTPKIGVFYAFEQIYKGDLGYKQKQKASTQEILDSMRFYPEPTGPEQPYDTYTNELNKFSFEHPKFDDKCCNLEGPPTNTGAVKIVTLADKSTFVDINNFDGISVFSYRLSDEKKETFDSFLEKQKKTLIDDYVVVRGTTPKLQEVSLKLGDKDAVLLRGYSWRDTDLIYCHIGSTNDKVVLILSVKNMTGDKFAEKVDRILSSFKFWKQQ
jgi:hypothetical protein